MNSIQPVPHHIVVAVVGGGLAGLTAATFAARAGASVVVFDARQTLGGRARTDETSGARLNHGAHALYSTGAARRILAELGIHPRGGLPAWRRIGWMRNGRRTPARRLRAIGGLAGPAAAVRMIRAGRRGPAPGETSMGEWLDAHVAAAARPFADFLVRTTSYVADPSCFDAAAALAQIRRGLLGGARYLDGGWITLVDGLVEAALRAGVTVVRGRVARIESAPDRHRVVLDGGDEITAAGVILAAGGPAQADHLLAGASPSLRHAAAGADPVQAYCLDVVLASVPSPAPTGLYGLGEPTYLANQSLSATLSGNGTSVLHGLVYEPDRWPGPEPRAMIEAMLDVQVPSWRADAVAVVERRRMVVAHDRPAPARLPTGGVVEVTLPDLDRVWVAGDWVFGDGLLADAAVGSARRAGLAAAAGVHAPRRMVVSA